MTELLRNGEFEEGLQHWEALGSAKEQGMSTSPEDRRVSLQSSGKLCQSITVARNASYKMRIRVRTLGDEGEAHVTLTGNVSGELVR